MLIKFGLSQKKNGFLIRKNVYRSNYDDDSNSNTNNNTKHDIKIKKYLKLLINNSLDLEKNQF